jgi:flagella basal body P-ring formation protein FlgA
MMYRAIVLLCWAARLAPAQAPACTTIGGDRVHASDLAITVPVFGAVPPETVIGYAPVPGVKRVLHASEIIALARRHSITLISAPDVCFAWEMETLDRARVLDAMQTSLKLPGTKIEIPEISLYPVPHGTIEFTRERLGSPASYDRPSPALWRGDVLYGGNRRFPIWARVTITAPVTRIFASASLKAGDPIQPEWLRVEAGEGFPRAGKEFSSAAAIAGMIPLRPIPAGGEILPSYLAASSDVNRGEPVEIEFRSDSTRLAITGRAESSGRAGETISVRNPESKKLFQARVSGKGKAIVEPALARKKNDYD